MRSMIERVRLSANFANIEERKETTAVPIRRASKQEYIRVHEEACVQNVALLEMRDESTMYVIDSELVAASGMSPSKGDFAVVDLHLAVTMVGSPFFLPARHGNDNWAVSGREVIEFAKRSWVRVTSDRQAGCYEANIAVNQLPDPVWPKKSMDELLEMALKTRFIDSPDHDIMKRLRGAF